MLKSSAQLMVAVMGLSAMAFSGGCDKLDSAISAKISRASEVAMKACLDAGNGGEGCEDGIMVGQSIGRGLESSLTVQIQGQERVTEFEMSGLGAYESLIDHMCHTLATPVRTDRDGFVHYGTTNLAEESGCIKGARELVIAIGNECGLDLSAMAADHVSACTARTAIPKKEEPKPAQPNLIPVCHSPARNCP